jgi:hypothetical protein
MADASDPTIREAIEDVRVSIDRHTHPSECT